MWIKVDDGMHAHRKTRAVTKGHGTKVRDAAPMGLWVLAASWAGQNGTDGWVPADELDRWDDDYARLADRLVAAGYWWPQERKGEPGYGFTDWHDYNDPTDSASRAGTFGNHVRWHVKQGRVEPTCEHCPKESNDPDIGASIGGESGAISPPDQGGISGAIALPEPEPDPTRPEPEPILLFDESNEIDGIARFDEFWNAYGKKVNRKEAERKWRLALKKPGITASMLIAAAVEYVTWERENNEGGRFIMGPAKWLLNERWNDERASRRPPQTRVQEHLSLVEQLAAEEAEAEQDVRQIGGSR